MELEVQHYLRSGRLAQDGILAFNKRKLEELAGAPYNLKIKRHNEFPNLVQFSYDQIESPRFHPIIVECRGLILDEANNWNVVAYPFKRFYNAGEVYAANINWETARVQEKVDGTLIIMYWYNDKWRIATRGSPDASGGVNGTPMMKNGVISEMTFADLFWNSCDHWLKGLSRKGCFNPNVTYMWELTSPHNRVVCDYTEIGPVGEVKDGNNEIIYLYDKVDKTGYAGDGSRITLLGSRDNISGRELYNHAWKDDVYYIAKEFPLKSLQDVFNAAAQLNPLKQEGFVVVDSDWNRIKIKSPAYVAIHHLREGNPRKRIVEIIQGGDGEEMLAYNILDEWPAEKQMYLEMNQKLEDIILTSEAFYATIKDIEVQKDFALQALTSPISGVLFAVRKGQITSIRKSVLGMQTDKLLDLIDGKRK